MPMSERQIALVADAAILAQSGQGMVIEDWAYPEAHELAEAGWLSRRLEADGELSWHLTREAHIALALGLLLDDAREAIN